MGTQKAPVADERNHSVSPFATSALRTAPASDRRVAYTKTVVVLGFAAGLLLSPKLWISSRFFPVIPIVPGFPPLHFPLDYICAGALFLLLCTIGVAANPRRYIFGFSTLLIFLALYDQTRWQPWVYLYLFVLLALSCYSWKPDDFSGAENTLNICRLIIGATYFYSGLQKLNPNFAELGIKSLLGPAMAEHLPLAHVWPWFMAVLEAGVGVALLTRGFRNIAVVGAVVMHLFILFSGIVLMHWNSVVWPWNLTMIAFVVMLFWKTDFSFADAVWRNPIWFQKVALVLFGVMPLLSFFGWWDSYLSASLYSGNVALANVLMSREVRDQLPPAIQKYAKEHAPNTYILVIRDWAVGELNVMPYPAERAYRGIGREICRYSQNSPDVVLVVRDRDTLLSKAAETHDNCFGAIRVLQR
jgi:uncharacterized membrane protein YphA (DoxX/SURF4 family)